MLRPREIVAPVRASTDVPALIDELRLEARLTPIGRLDVRVRGRAPRAARPVARSEPARVRPRGSRCGDARRRRARAVSARHAEGGSRRTSATSSYRTGADCLLIDPTTLRNLEVVRGRRRRARRVAAARDRSHRHADGRAACCARGCCARWRRSSASRIASTRSRNSRSASTERAKLRDTLKVDPRHRAPGRARGARHRRVRATSCRSRQSIAAMPRVRMLLDELQAPLDPQPGRRARRSGRCARRPRRDAARRAAGASRATAA